MTATAGPASAVLTAFADEVGTAGPVAVEGGRTRWDRGGLPAEGTRLVRAPSGVVDHRPEEMTVRVLAGTTVEELHGALAAAGQRSALPERGGTVGGALAVGENALSCLGRGRVRDAVLEVRYVSGEGRLVKGGAPTVKNVSGFDLPRLLVGSLGTLGLLAEVVLRTRPLPPAARWLVSASADPFACREAARSASCILWDGEQTFVELEGHEVDVDADASALATLGDWQRAAGPPTLPRHRWSLRPSQLRALVASPPVPPADVVASIGVGVVFASRPRRPSEPEAGVRLLASRMKAELDPAGRLNPGRDPGRP